MVLLLLLLLLLSFTITGVTDMVGVAAEDVVVRRELVDVDADMVPIRAPDGVLP